MVAVPTLSADEALWECVRSLERQGYPGLEIIVIDNSGEGKVRRAGLAPASVRVIENPENAGFGRAINQAIQASAAEYVATLNDDAVACPHWVESLVRAMDADAAIGMLASQVTLAESGLLDSAGMLMSGDGSSKQRGHGRPAAEFAVEEDVLLPSGSAAMYRRAMLEQIGLFDDDYFLYCEDTDLGLRGRWAGWRCRYVPEARVVHRYSHSAGRVSALKAYYVERNRLYTAVKNLPAGLLWRAPFKAVERYFWHAWLARTGVGVAGRFNDGGAIQLAWIVVRAHLAMFAHLPTLFAQRRAIRRTARVGTGAFAELLRRFSISPREVAAQ